MSEIMDKLVDVADLMVRQDETDIDTCILVDGKNYDVHISILEDL